MRAVARRTLAQLGLDIDVRVPVERLSLATQQLVAIARALVLQVRVLIMDEPTAALDDWEADRLLGIVRELRSAGVAIVYVSHRLGEVRQIADTVTVMRDGRLVATRPIDDLDDGSLVRHMVGRTMEQLTRRMSVCHAPGRPADDAAVAAAVVPGRDVRAARRRSARRRRTDRIRTQLARTSIVRATAGDVGHDRGRGACSAAALRPVGDHRRHRDGALRIARAKGCSCRMTPSPIPQSSVWPTSSTAG